MEKEQEKGVVYFVYGNIQMAITTTKHLIEICEDEKLRKNLADEDVYKRQHLRLLTSVRLHSSQQPVSQSVRRTFLQSLCLTAMYMLLTSVWAQI